MPKSIITSIVIWYNEYNYSYHTLLWQNINILKYFQNWKVFYSFRKNLIQTKKVKTATYGDSSLCFALSHIWAIFALALSNHHHFFYHLFGKTVFLSNLTTFCFIISCIPIIHSGVIVEAWYWLENILTEFEAKSYLQYLQNLPILSQGQ